jgi:hypothetical protein
MANSYFPVFICYTNQDKYNQLKALNLESVETDNKHNHTLYIVNETGIPNTEALPANIYLGNQIITDIVNLNLISDIQIIKDEETDRLTVKRNGNVDLLIGNKNKLYLYGDYEPVNSKSYFNLYFYDENIQQYLPLTTDGVTTDNINFVNSETDIGDNTKYIPKKFVYYLQDPVPITRKAIKLNLKSETDNSFLSGTTVSVSGTTNNGNKVKFTVENIINSNDNTIIEPNETITETVTLTYTSGTTSLDLELDNGNYAVQPLQNTEGYNLDSTNFNVSDESQGDEISVESIQLYADISVYIGGYNPYVTTESELPEFLSGVDCVITGKTIDTNNIIMFNNSTVIDAGNNTNVSVNGSQITWTSGTSILKLRLVRGLYTITVLSVPTEYGIPTPITFISPWDYAIPWLMVCTRNEFHMIEQPNNVTTYEDNSHYLNLYSYSQDGVNYKYGELGNSIIPNAAINKYITEQSISDTITINVNTNVEIPDQSSYTDIDSNMYILPQKDNYHGPYLTTTYTFSKNGVNTNRGITIITACIDNISDRHSGVLPDILSIFAPYLPNIDITYLRNYYNNGSNSNIIKGLSPLAYQLKDKYGNSISNQTYSHNTKFAAKYYIANNVVAICFALYDGISSFRDYRLITLVDLDNPNCAYYCDYYHNTSYAIDGNSLKEVGYNRHTTENHNPVIYPAKTEHQLSDDYVNSKLNAIDPYNYAVLLDSDDVQFFYINGHNYMGNSYICAQIN